MLRIRLNRENECTKGSIFGVQALSAKQNFQIKGNGLNKTFIKNIARIKRAAAITNCNGQTAFARDCICNRSSKQIEAVANRSSMQ